VNVLSTLNLDFSILVVNVAATTLNKLQHQSRSLGNRTPQLDGCSEVIFLVSKNQGKIEKCNRFFTRVLIKNFLEGDPKVLR